MTNYYLATEVEGYSWTKPPSWGFNEEHKLKAQLTRPGDMLVGYVKGCGYACTMEILAWEDTGRRVNIGLTLSGFCRGLSRGPAGSDSRAPCMLKAGPG